jgi:hypothetical protein
LKLKQLAVVKNLEQLAFKQGIASIYKTCDTIESLEESLNTLLYDDHNFKNYEIIYFVIRAKEILFASMDIIIL